MFDLKFERKCAEKMEDLDNDKVVHLPYLSDLLTSWCFKNLAVSSEQKKFENFFKWLINKSPQIANLLPLNEPDHWCFQLVETNSNLNLQIKKYCCSLLFWKQVVSTSWYSCYSSNSA